MGRGGTEAQPSLSMGVCLTSVEPQIPVAQQFHPLTPGLQLLPVTPSTVPFFFPPGVPQPDQEELLEVVPEVQFPDGSHGVGMAHNEPHLCLCLHGAARGLLGHEE